MSDFVEWRNIMAFPGYQVSNTGRVRSCLQLVSAGGGRGFKSVLGEDGFELKPIQQKYLKVNLHRNGKKHLKCVHILVMEAFVGRCPPGMEACHNDGNPTNNDVSNLRWDTHKSNCADKQTHGTIAAGERNGRSKITESQARN